MRNVGRQNYDEFLTIFRYVGVNDARCVGVGNDRLVDYLSLYSAAVRWFIVVQTVGLQQDAAARGKLTIGLGDDPVFLDFYICQELKLLNKKISRNLMAVGPKIGSLGHFVRPILGKINSQKVTKFGPKYSFMTILGQLFQHLTT